LAVANLENSIKTLGFKPMSRFDKLRSVYRLIVNGGRSNGWVEKNLGIKGTDRVIFTGWARFIQYCEMEMDWGFRLWERLDPANQFKRDENGQLMKDGDEFVPNPDWIDLWRFKQEAWQGPTGKDHVYKDVAMGAMTDLTKNLVKFNTQREEKGKPFVTRPTERKYVESWIDFWNSGEGHKDARHKMMDQTEVENIKNASPIRLARQIAGAIYNRDNSGLSKLAERAFVYNFVHDCTDKSYTSLENLLKEIKRAEFSEDELIGLYEALTENVKGFVGTKS